MPESKPKLSAAERSRNYRARKAQERKEQAAAEKSARDARDAAAAADRKAKQELPISNLEAVNLSLAAMKKWLRDSDLALVNQARFYAAKIDRVEEEEPGATGKLASLGQLLARLLHQLGATPTVRMQHELRSLRLAAGLPSSGDDDRQNNAPAKPEAGDAIVTPIKRPPKRARA